MDSVIIYLLWQYSVWENSRAFVLYLTVLNHHLRLILNPFVQTKAIQGVDDINPIFMKDASFGNPSRNTGQLPLKVIISLMERLRRSLDKAIKTLV